MFKFVCALLVFVGSLLRSRADESTLTIGIIDLKHVVKEYHQTKDVVRRVAEARQEATVKLQRYSVEYLEGMRRWEKAKADLPKWEAIQLSLTGQPLTKDMKDYLREKVETMAGKLRSMEQNAKDFRRRREIQLQEYLNRERKLILESIKAHVISKAKSGGYDIVLDSSCTGQHGVKFLLFSSEADDLTETILRELNGENQRKCEPKTERKETSGPSSRK